MSTISMWVCSCVKEGFVVKSFVLPGLVLCQRMLGGGWIVAVCGNRCWFQSLMICKRISGHILCLLILCQRMVGEVRCGCTWWQVATSAHHDLQTYCRVQHIPLQFYKLATWRLVMCFVGIGKHAGPWQMCNASTNAMIWLALCQCHLMVWNVSVAWCFGWWEIK